MRANKTKGAVSLAVTVVMVALLGGVAFKESDAKNASKVAPTTPAKEAAAEAPPNSDWQARCQDIKDGEKVTGKYCEAVQSLYVVKKDEDPKKSTTQHPCQTSPNPTTCRDENPSSALPLSPDFTNPTTERLRHGQHRCTPRSGTKHRAAKRLAKTGHTNARL